MEGDDQFPEKYASYIKAGLSRQYIENSLQDDGYSGQDIEEFWIAVNQKAIAEACADASVPLTDIWTSLKKFQTVLPYEPLNAQQIQKPAPDGHFRVVCISDTHGLHENLLQYIPDGDILLHAGDFTDTGDRAEVLAFNEFLGRLPHRHKIVIAGNHEGSFDATFYEERWQQYGHKRKHDSSEVRSILTNGVYLEDQLVVVKGLKIYGTPWQPAFCDWAFNLKRGEALQEKWKRIPDGVDILLTHSPPLGRGDAIRNGNHRTGDVDLLREVQERIIPKYHVFGHVHEGYGCSSDGNTVYINASTCTHSYEPSNKPVVFDIPIPTAESSTNIYGEVLYEELIIKAKKRRSQLRRVSFDIDSIPPPPRPIHQDLSHLKIVGTESDKMFNKLLQAQPNKIRENHRAMRYLFHRGITEDFEQNKRQMHIQKEPRSEPLRIPPEDPDYTIQRSRTRRGTLRRRVTVSVLVMPSDTDNPKDEQDEKIPSVRRAGGFQKSLIRREGVADLPVEVEEGCVTCVMCKFKVSGHNCANSVPISVEVKEVSVEQPLEECIMCKFKVNGHNCKVKESEDEEEKKPAEDTSERSPERRLSKTAREFSSWF